MTAKEIYKLITKIVGSIALLLGGLFVLLYVSIVLAMTSLRAGLYTLLWLGFILGFVLCIMRRIWGVRWFARIGRLLIILPILAWAGVEGYDWWTKGRFEKLENRVEWWKYRPFEKDTKLVSVVAPEEFRFEGDAPRIDCAYALYPIGAAAYQALSTETNKISINSVSSPRAYADLTGHFPMYASDLILALAPSEADIKAAAEKELAFELTPIAKDAFVFIVPITNPIEGLTSEQIRGIYSGKITSWRELGVDLDVRLMPYQRNERSGSQTALERLMGETPIMPPIKEDRLGGMGGIISATADYRNYPGAIGFTFRYYANELVRDKRIKLLKIDGIDPTVENIRSGRYPFVETAYAITVSERKGNVKRFIDFLVSPVGQLLIEKTGYVLP